MSLENPGNNTVEKVDFRSCQNGKDKKYVVGSYTKSVETCPKCVQKGNMKIICKSKRNGYYGGLSKRLTIKLPK